MTKTKTKLGKVLVLTPLHPIDVVNANIELKNFDIMSIQMMALLAEETYRGEPRNEKESIYINKNYGFWNTLFLNAEKDAKIRSSIIFGNYPKTEKKKFSHIISLADYRDEDWLYDKTMLESFDGYLPALYTKEDVEYFFPTWRHLKLFLTANGAAEKGVSSDNV